MPINFGNLLKGEGRVPFNNAQGALEAAQAISMDAQDSTSKLAPLMALFAFLVSQEKYDVDKDNIFDDDDYNNYADLFDECQPLLQDKMLTLGTNDGDLICLYFEPDFAPEPSPAHRLSFNRLYCRKRVVVNNESTYVDTLISDGFAMYISPDQEAIDTVGGSYTWSPTQIANSLAGQLQSCEIISRLANLVGSENMDAATIDATFSDIAGVLTQENAEYLSRIKGFGAAISSDTVLGVVKETYGSMRDYTIHQSTPDSIDFDDTTYCMHDFNLTTFFGFVGTAVEAMGMLLVVSGGIIAKIGYIGYSMISGVFNAAQRAAVDAESPVIDIDNANCEFAVPLFQGQVNKSAASAYATVLEQFRIVKLTFPFGNVYLWDAGDATTYNMAVYANLRNQIDGLEYYEANVEAITTSQRQILKIQSGVIDDNYTTTLKFVGMCSTAQALDTEHHVVAFPYALIAGFDPQYGPSTCAKNCYGPLLNSDEDYIKRRVLTAINQWFYWCGCCSIEGAYDSNYYKQVVSITTSGLNDGAIALQLYNGRDWANDSPELLCSVIAYTLHANPSWAPSWEDIVNKIVPACQRCFNIIYGLAPLGRRALDQLYYYDDDDPHAGNIVCSITQVSGFRSGYAVTPPRFSSGAFGRAALIALACVGAVVAVALTVKTMVKVKSKPMMTKKYIKVQKQWDNLKAMDPSANPEAYDAAFNSYKKSIKSYNRFARMLGFSTLSMVQGWETGDVSTPATNAANADIDLQTLVLESMGVNASGDSFDSNVRSTANQSLSVSLSQIINLIKGTDI